MTVHLRLDDDKALFKRKTPVYKNRQGFLFVYWFLNQGTF